MTFEELKQRVTPMIEVLGFNAALFPSAAHGAEVVISGGKMPAGKQAVFCVARHSWETIDADEIKRRTAKYL